MAKDSLSLHAVSGTKFSKAQKQKLFDAHVEALRKVFPDKIIVQVVFKESLGNVFASQHRAGQTIAQGKERGVPSAHIALNTAVKNDTITVVVQTAGPGGTLTILNADTDPKTPMFVKDDDNLGFDVL